MAPKAGGLSLERARARFVDWLAVELGDRASAVTMIFDSNRPAGGTQTHRGIELKFADACTADDLIEELIDAELVPGRLTIVSNDNRLQAAAIRRRGISWNCGEFIDWLQMRTSAPPDAVPKSEEEKPSAPSRSEMDEWLQRFES
jgi:predicted RNA-binding protein with PIN domain